MYLEPRLRAFAALAREGSFSRAADSLYLSQPAVSKHVAAIEAQLGVRLVTRGRAGATLTRAGRLLADYVLRAEALLANAQRTVAADSAGDTGRLAMAASGVPGTYILPPLVAAFHRRYPGVEIALEMSTSAGALEAVRVHRAELAVIGGLTVPAELEAETLADDDIVVVGPRSASTTRLGPSALDSLTWISREEGSSTRAAVDAARRQLGLHDAQRLELPSWEAVKLAVAEGGGIAAISRRAIEHEVASGRLVILDLPRWRVTRTIALVRARDVPLTPPAARFASELRTAFRDALPGPATIRPRRMRGTGASGRPRAREAPQSHDPGSPTRP
jgi:DNA-binding transcriptional LysR family regulator